MGDRDFKFCLLISSGTYNFLVIFLFVDLILLNITFIEQRNI